MPSSKVIYRYAIPGPTETVLHEIPMGAEQVHFGFKDDGSLNLWMEVDHDVTEKSKVQFITIGTGYQYESDWTHIGTYPDGPFVWHVLAKELI